MPSDIQKRDEVEQILLALLVSQKGGTTLPQLEYDYYEQEGIRIPWKELGFVSLLDLLKNMSKHVRLDMKNGTYFAYGIASEKSKHVQSLVDRQKIQKKIPNSYRKRYFRSNHFFPNTQLPKVRLSADCLSNIVDQVKKSPYGISKYFLLDNVHKNLPNINITMMDFEDQLRSLSHQLYVEGNLVFPHRSDLKESVDESQKSSGKSYQIEQKETQPQRFNISTKYSISGDDNEFSNDEMDMDDGILYVPSGCPISLTNYKNIKPSKRTVPVSQFIKESVTSYHCNHFSASDNKSSEMSQNDTTESCISNEHEQNEINLSTTSNGEQQSNKIQLLINDRLKSRLKELVMKYPNGIWCSELPSKYLQEYKVSLNYTELGFYSVIEFVSHLPTIFRLERPNPLGDFILYSAESDIPQCASQVEKTAKKSDLAKHHSTTYLENKNTEPVPTVVSDNTRKNLTPNNVMALGESVGHISVKKLSDSWNQFVEVFVVEVFTPSLFWIRLYANEKAFKEMMENLKHFYMEHHESYAVPPILLEKGLNCACIYNGDWHRGIIKLVKPDLQVTVMFYDYGTLKTYPPDAIHYLHKSFAYLPAQAIPCGLYNTKPIVGDEWSRGVTHEFALKTSFGPLVATIKSVDEETNSMLVGLTDTTLDKVDDFHINDWMVYQNLAVRGKMVRIRPRNFPFRYYLNCQARSKEYNTEFEEAGTSINVFSELPILMKRSRQMVEYKATYNNENCTLSTSTDNNSASKRLRHLLLKRAYKTETRNVSLYETLKNVVSHLNGQNSNGETSSSSTISSVNDALQHKQNKESSTDFQSDSFSVQESMNKEKISNESNDMTLNLSKKTRDKDVWINRCFINAVNLSMSNESYRDDDVAIEDNVSNIENINNRRLMRYRQGFKFLDTTIAVPEKILNTLKLNTVNHQVNDIIQDNCVAIDEKSQELEKKETIKQMEDQKLHEVSKLFEEERLEKEKEGTYISEENNNSIIDTEEKNERRENNETLCYSSISLKERYQVLNSLIKTQLENQSDLDSDDSFHFEDERNKIVYGEQATKSVEKSLERNNEEETTLIYDNRDQESLSVSGLEESYTEETSIDYTETKEENKNYNNLLEDIEIKETNKVVREEESERSFNGTYEESIKKFNDLEESADDEQEWDIEGELYDFFDDVPTFFSDILKRKKSSNEIAEINAQ